MPTNKLRDEMVALQNCLNEARRDREQLYGASAGGQKAQLAQMRNYYLRIIQADPDEADKLFAVHQHNLSLIR